MSPPISETRPFHRESLETGDLKVFSVAASSVSSCLCILAGKMTGCCKLDHSCKPGLCLIVLEAKKFKVRWLHLEKLLPNHLLPLSCVTSPHGVGRHHTNFNCLAFVAALLSEVMNSLITMDTHTAELFLLHKMATFQLPAPFPPFHQKPLNNPHHQYLHCEPLRPMVSKEFL